MSADALAIEIDGGARIEWATDALRDLAAGGMAEPAWRLEGDVDWDAVESLRVVSAAFEDGRLLAVVASRPGGADGHDEAPRGALVQPDGEVVALAETLLSTEYDADGAPSRIGLELYREPDGIPLRVAADRESPAWRFRMEGVGGSGTFEQVSRA